MDNVRQDGDKYRKKEDVYLKFPAILKEKLQSGEIHFPEKTQFEYQPIRAYRGIAREEEDDTPVNINDFRSYAEMERKRQEEEGLIHLQQSITEYLYLRNARLLRHCWHFQIQGKK